VGVQLVAGTLGETLIVVRTPAFTVVTASSVRIQSSTELQSHLWKAEEAGTQLLTATVSENAQLPLLSNAIIAANITNVTFFNFLI
jgi:hypothetical protein